MNRGIFANPSKAVLLQAAPAVDLSEWTRCLVYDGTPGTRRFVKPPGVTEVLVVVKSASGSGAARYGAGAASGGAGDALAAAIIELGTDVTYVDYTVGAAGVASVVTGSGSANGSPGGSSSFGSYISCTGGGGGLAAGTAATPGVPSIAVAKTILALYRGGASGFASASAGSAATGGGSAAGGWGDGFASGAVSTNNSPHRSASGGGSCFASSGAITNVSGHTGGAGTTASSSATGGGPAAVLADLVATFTGSPAVPAASFLDFLFTAAALADVVPPAAGTTWASVTDSTGRSGGSAMSVTSVGLTGTNTGEAGDGGHFAGGGAAVASGSSTSGTHTLRAGAGGRFGGGGAAAADFSSGSSGGTLDVVGGAGRLGGGGGAAIVVPGAGMTCSATSGTGADGLVVVFAKASA